MVVRKVVHKKKFCLRCCVAETETSEVFTHKNEEWGQMPRTSTKYQNDLETSAKKRLSVKQQKPQLQGWKKMETKT